MNDDGTFQVLIAPRAEDIDELGHVSNVSYVRWIQDVARQASDACGWDLPAYTALGAVFVVRRHEVEYLRQAYLGEELQGTTWVSSWKGASSWRETRITRGDELVVRARTLWALIDRDRGRPCRIPAALRAAFPLVEREG